MHKRIQYINIYKHHQYIPEIQLYFHPSAYPSPRLDSSTCPWWERTVKAGSLRTIEGVCPEGSLPFSSTQAPSLRSLCQISKRSGDRSKRDFSFEGCKTWRTGARLRPCRKVVKFLRWNRCTIPQARHSKELHCLLHQTGVCHGSMELI